MYAVIKTGGKQYRVAADDKLAIEKIAGEAGSEVEFTEVLMLGGDGDAKIGAPAIAGAKVLAEVVEQGRAAKVIAFKKRRRQNSRRKRGHRQDLTVVRITAIGSATGEPRKAKRAAKPAAASEAPDAAPAQTA